MPTLRRTAILDFGLELEPYEVRQVRLGARLCAVVAHAYKNAPRVRRALDAAGVGPEDVRGLEDLEKLPITRKEALPAMQAEEAPLGGLLGVPVERLARIFMSPGPIFDPQGDTEDFWRFRHALAAAGFRRGEIAHNSASYHLTPLGFMLDAAARSHGCIVVPAGVGQTDLQIQVASRLRATAYLGTPSFLHALVSRARAVGTPLHFETAFVLAEMLPETLRAELEGDFGIRVLQGYGTADLGCVAYECPEKDGWHAHPECVVEVLDLESRRAAVPGQPGEVVVIDAGAEYQGYAADVTRTLPASGTFSQEQRAIYRIVRDAQAAAERNSVAGRSIQAALDSSIAVRAAGLAGLGLVESAEATFDPPWPVNCTSSPWSCRQVMLFGIHGITHGIGLEVHDPIQAYDDGIFKVGDAFTIEPGLYISPGLLDLLPDTPKNRAFASRVRATVERYQNTGVRIEDSYLISKDGLEWLSRVPRDLDEVEALTRRRPIP